MSWWGHRKHREYKMTEPTLEEAINEFRRKRISDVLACDFELDGLCIDLELVSGKREKAIRALQFILPGTLDAEDVVMESRQALDAKAMELEVLADIARLPGEPA